MNYFDEEWYLLKYPDVRVAIDRGDVTSARDHYRSHGQSEGRMACDPKLLDKLIEADKLTSRICHFDQMFVTNGGFTLILGWLDNRSDDIQSLVFTPFVGQSITLDRYLLRYYREDVSEKKAKDDKNYDYGVWMLFRRPADRIPHLGGMIRADFVSERTWQMELPANLISPEEMRNRVLDVLSKPTKCQTSPSLLGEIVGPLLRELNLELVNRIALASPSVIHGTRLSSPALSIVVVYQRTDWMLRQAALFAELPAVKNIEFIYINYRPETTSNLHAIAGNAHVLYGLNMITASTSDYTGLATAIGHAAQLASAKTLLFLSDSIIPGDRDCFTRALSVASEMGEHDVIGALLLTEDNSIQHAGRAFKLTDNVNNFWGLEDTHKGMPADRLWGRPPMEVDSVGISAMLVRRASFLNQDGFDNRYLSDEYLGSDYCLRSHLVHGRTIVDPRLLFYYIDERRPIAPQPKDWAVASMDMVYFNQKWQSTIEDLQMNEDTSSVALMPRKRGPFDT